MYNILINYFNFYTLTGATVMDTQSLVKSVGGTLIVLVRMGGR